MDLREERANSILDSVVLLSGHREISLLGRRKTWKRFGGRRLIGLTLLAVICASYVPLPIGGGSSRVKDLSKPFPCQNRPCGCPSAEHCWKRCCCFTNAQKVAWARANGVRLPDYVAQAAEAEADDKWVARRTQPKSGCPHCTQAATESCADGICSIDNNAHESNDRPSESSPRKSVRYVISIEVAKCHGAGNWLCCGSLPWTPSPTVDIPQFHLESGKWDFPSAWKMASVSPEPPEPPPRLA